MIPPKRTARRKLNEAKQHHPGIKSLRNPSYFFLASEYVPLVCRPARSSGRSSWRWSTCTALTSPIAARGRTFLWVRGKQTLGGEIERQSPGEGDRTHPHSCASVRGGWWVPHLELFSRKAVQGFNPNLFFNPSPELYQFFTQKIRKVLFF